jgi:hypothetical protein
MPITNRAADRELLADLASVLQISARNLHRDPCGDWIISGRRGHVLTDGRDVYVYLPSGTARRWEAAKRALAFMTVTQDGDEEGILKFQGTPTAEQAATLRKLLGSRYVPPMSDEERAAIARRFAASSQRPSQAPIIAQSDPAATKPQPEPRNAKSSPKPPVSIPPAPEAKWRPRPVVPAASPTPQEGELLFVRSEEDGYAVVGAYSKAIVRTGLKSGREADAWIDGFTTSEGRRKSG